MLVPAIKERATCSTPRRSVAAAARAPISAHARHTQAGFHQAAERVGFAFEVFLKVPDHVLGIVQRRQHIHEAKQLQAGVLVAHGPFEQLPRPPLGPEKRAGVFLHPLEQLPPDALRRLLHFLGSAICRSSLP